MSYATLADFKSYISEMTGGIQTTFTAAENTVLQLFLDQADAEINGYTGRHFGQGANNHTHYYTEEDIDGDTLYLDADLVSVVTLTNGDGTVISSSDYWLLPMNASITGEHTFDGSYWGIRLKSTTEWQTPTDGRISVVGRWGYMQGAPIDVVRCAMRIAYWYWTKRNQTGATEIAGEQLTQQSDSYPTDVRIILERYKRRMIR